jgi:hypothetical protein
MVERVQLILRRFVHSERGATECWLLPTVSCQAFSRVLEAFAQAVGAGADKRILLVVDHAGWHSSPRVRVPAGLHLEPFPSCSHELQPAEWLWPLTNKSLANRAFATLTELDTVLGDGCVQLAKRPHWIRAHTLFHWWPRLATITEAIRRS